MLYFAVGGAVIALQWAIIFKDYNTAKWSRVTALGVRLQHNGERNPAHWIANYSALKYSFWEKLLPETVHSVLKKKKYYYWLFQENKPHLILDFSSVTCLFKREDFMFSPNCVWSLQSLEQNFCLIFENFGLTLKTWSMKSEKLVWKFILLIWYRLIQIDKWEGTQIYFLRKEMQGFCTKIKDDLKIVSCFNDMWLQWPSYDTCWEIFDLPDRSSTALHEPRPAEPPINTYKMLPPH